MPRYLLPPISDAGPNDGQRFPASPSTHFDKLDEDPNDGDTTRIAFLVPGNIEACAYDVGVIPDEAVITAVIVRWAMSGRLDATCHAEAGLRLGGVYFYGTQILFEVGQPYTVNETAFYKHPGTNARWKKGDLSGGAVACQYTQGPEEPSFPPRPRLSELVVLVDANLPAPKGAPGSSAPSASASGSPPGAAPSASAASAASSPVVPLAAPSAAAALASSTPPRTEAAPSAASPVAAFGGLTDDTTAAPSSPLTTVAAPSSPASGAAPTSAAPSGDI